MKITAVDTTPDALSITELTMYLKGVVEDTFPGVWVVGEVSNLSRPRSGHLYMTLKDDTSQIRAVMWKATASKLRFDLREGQQVLAFGGVEIYAPQGVYQIVLRQLEPLGMGALQLAFQQLQQRLQSEGLFDPSKKKKLPKFPRRIAVVTSSTGAAIRDFLEIALRRWPKLDVTIVPAKVQGPGAAQSIVSAIQAAHRIKPAMDVLLITRGGGSIEDLWCFNEEPVVRAIAASRIPTVSAIGHEIDVTLSDFAADLRALTPSEAAEKIVPEYSVFEAEFNRLAYRLKQPLLQRLKYHREQLRQLAQRPAFRRPHDRFRQYAQQLDDIDTRGKLAMTRILERKRKQLEHDAASLQALSPLAVLSRGYSITQHFESKAIVMSAAQVKVGDRIQTQTKQGIILSTVVDQ